MRTRKLWSWMILLASFAFLSRAATIARAQDQESAQGQDQYDDQSQDPPGRVARLDYSQGSVSFRPAGEDDWVTGVPNRPMVTGDDLWSDEGSRAEIHIGSTAMRLGEKTGITFLTLDDQSTQIRLAQGSLIVRVRHVDDDDNYEIDTPNVAFTLQQPGEYRLDVSADGTQTITTVFHGRGRVTGGGFSYTVIANQSATFTGNDQHLDYDLAQLPNQDNFDEWAFDRDAHEDRADSANYVSREMTGYEDLDDNGSWSYAAGYGEVWQPTTVAVGWAPYRFGHWVWVNPWGWTWVEDEPWGFAPFHYGRWAFGGGRWFWVPGPVVVRPMWAPALVAFVGGGPGFRFSAGVGVGWFPLGPGEVFVPSYHVSRGYVNNVNITNTTVNVTKVTNVYNTVIVNKTTTINNVYVNQHVNNGVTVVSHDAFVNSRPVAQNVMKVDAREIAAAPVSHVVAAEPVRGSVMGAGRPAAVKPPAAVMSRQVVAVRTPPPPPHPIEQQQASAGGHLNQQLLVRPAAPARPAPTNQGTTPPNQQGFKSFNQPSGGNTGGNNAGSNQVKQMPNTQPRTFEQQGTPQPENRPENRPANPNVENRNVPEPNRNVQPEPSRNMQPPNRNVQPENQSRSFQPPPKEMMTPQPPHPLVHTAPPVEEHNPQVEQQKEDKFRQWQQQRPAPPPPPKPQPKSEPARSSPPAKKGH